MDVEQKQEQILATLRVIAMAALELPHDKRQAFIERAVTMTSRNHEATPGSDPHITEMRSKLLELTRHMLRILEESGGTIGHA